MNSEKLAQTLKSVNENEEGAMEKLAFKLIQETRETPRALVSLCEAKDTDLANRAQELFLLMEDTVVRPVAGIGPEVPEMDRIWLLQGAVKAEVELRRVLARELEKMLNENAVIPPPSSPVESEEEQPLVRVCDQSYIELRRLLYGTENIGDAILNRDRFLQLELEERDQEIRKFLTTREFRNFMTDSPDVVE